MKEKKQDRLFKWARETCGPYVGPLQSASLLLGPNGSQIRPKKYEICNTPEALRGEAYWGLW